MTTHIDIRPATLGQAQRALNGNLIFVDDDVANVAKDLREIDPRLKVRFSPDEEVFIVFYGDEDREELVTTCRELDQRLVARVRKLASESYDFAAELDKAEAERAAVKDSEFRERVGDAGERLAHAVRKDLNDESRVFFGGVHQ